MTVEQLRSVHRARPFLPFTIHTGGGRGFFAKHPDFLPQSPSGRTIIAYGDEENFSILELLLVTELEVHGPPKRPEDTAA